MRRISRRIGLWALAIALVASGCEGGNKSGGGKGTKITKVEIRPEKPGQPGFPAPPDKAGTSAGSTGSGGFEHTPLDKLEGQVVFVTHPTIHVLRSLHAMVTAKVLTAKRLQVVGLYHGAERPKTYERSRTFVQLQALPWLHLHRIDCRLRPEKIFGENACTPLFRKLAAKASGFVFTGGADIPPALYGKKTSLTTMIRTPRRQWWELSLLAHLLGGSRSKGLEPLLAKRDKVAVLGICMGLQAMNVATGGTLHQDILSDVYRVKTFEEAEKLKPEQIHRSVEHALRPGPAVYAGVYHPIRFTGAPKLKAKLAPGKGPVKVMSIHHQALNKIGQGLEVIATSMDGKVVEVARHRTFPNVLGVQFHPEYHFLDLAVLTKARSMGRRGKALMQQLTAQPLMGDPASLEFHRQLWLHFSAQLGSS
jgi:putative glutamine amidotransferase